MNFLNNVWARAAVGAIVVNILFIAIHTPVAETFVRSSGMYKQSLYHPSFWESALGYFTTPPAFWRAALGAIVAARLMKPLRAAWLMGVTDYGLWSLTYAFRYFTKALSPSEFRLYLPLFLMEGAVTALAVFLIAFSIQHFAFLPEHESTGRQTV